MFKSCCHLVVAVGLALLAPAALAKAPIEAFGDVPEIRAVAMSPSGEKIAYLLRRGDADQLMLMDLKTRKSESLASATDFKARGVSWAGNEYVILHASKTTQVREFRYMISDRFEHTSAFAINIKTKSSAQLLRRADFLTPAQSGLGRIQGYDPDGKHVYMPAYAGEINQPTENIKYDLIRVSLENGNGPTAGRRRGEEGTEDWVINTQGEVIAREDFDDKSLEYSIRAYGPGGIRKIYSSIGDENRRNVLGVSEDQKSLVVSDLGDEENYAVRLMSLADGALGEPLLRRSDADIETAVTDHVGRVFRGVEYGGMFPTYKFLDPALDADIKGIQAKFPEAAVSIASWSGDWSKVVLYIEGGTITPRYALFDRKARTMDLIAAARPSLKGDDLGQVMTIEYKARDGLTIPALITWPPGVKEADRKNLPMIVMPHGGPESYDSVGFDWLAQFMANEGYVVLQPNFRGSRGFGESFTKAGYGQWGRKMQTDIDDGAKALADIGWVDPKRVCIVGGSYGGYAALMGGATAPDLYKCVVSIAGVSDLNSMLGEERRGGGRTNQDFRYWVRVIGDPDREGEAIAAVSPVNLAANFKSPVLLIHGTDDFVVPKIQSDKMQDALKKAGKEVDYMILQGDDHGLSNAANRIAALKRAAEFVGRHIGAK